jgi:hypothetical protein
MGEISVTTVMATSLCEGALIYCFRFVYDIAASTNSEENQAVTQHKIQH